MAYPSITELIDAVATKVRRDPSDDEVIAAANAAVEYVVFDNDLSPVPADVDTRERTADVATLTTLLASNVVEGELFTVADVGDGFDGLAVALAGSTGLTLVYDNIGDDLAGEAATGTATPASASGTIPAADVSPLTFAGLALLGARIVVDTPTPDGQVLATADPTFAGVFVPESLAAHLRDYWRRGAETMGAA